MKNLDNLNNLKVRKVLKEVDDRMANIFKSKLKKVIVYGSYARNENTSESDIDIMVLVNEDEQKIKEYEDSITDIMVDLSLKYNIVVSIYTQSVQEYEMQINVLPFLMNVEREGINIHG
ncbi:Nucleotidyltransferase domain protein [Clostridium luticellarii]|uniref:Nucleotidyltransferase domain protein n=1 Tax=Clostridium luticellarii TaxID=1691940 RepID=A0A2T0BGE2_9CLOT|nr:Nucleotidyltransferase domain protein [Clostridium luticellarii]